MPSSTEPEKEAFELEDDVRVVEELQQSGTIGAIQAALRNYELTDEDILKIVPRALVRLAYALGDTANVEKLKALPGGVEANRLDAIAKFLQAEFPDLRRHRAAMAYMKTLAAQTGIVGRPDSVQEITSINHLQTWLGSPPSLFPALRFVLSGPKEQILFDHVTGIDDLLFLARGTTQVIADVLQDAVEMRRRGFVFEIPQGYQATTQSTRDLLKQIDMYLEALVHRQAESTEAAPAEPAP